jgi:hypothetical protein
MKRLWILTCLGLAALAVAAAPPVQAGYVFTTFTGPGDVPIATTANGINNNGDIVGFSTNFGGQNFTNFIRNANGTLSTLTTLPFTAQANGINDNRSVVGAVGTSTVLLVTPGSTPIIGPGGAFFGINDRNSIVGQFFAASNTPGFVLFGTNNESHVTNLIPTDPSGQPALVTNAQGINNNNVGVGFETIQNNGLGQHGFTFTTAGVRGLIPDPSGTSQINQDGIALTQFLGVNDSDMAVGYYQTNSGSQHGFLYNLDTNTYTFLDDPDAVPGVTGASITQITGINDSGEITGFFVNADGVQEGFFAVPTAVPEPSSLSLLAVGAAGLATRVWRRRTKRGNAVVHLVANSPVV